MSLLSVAFLALCAGNETVPQETSIPKLGEAPDGHLGFGAELRLHDIHALDDDDGEGPRLVKHLRALEREARVFEALAFGCARARGQLDFVRGGASSLEELFARWDVFARDPFRQPLSPDEARAAVLVLNDPVLHTRRALLERTAVDRAELAGALALFRATQAKRLALSDSGETQRIGVRADLAAARMRALVRDLERLYESPAYATRREPTGLGLDLVISLVAGDREQGPVVWDRALREMEAERRHQISSLESSSLAAHLRSELNSRRSARRRAGSLYRSALEWLPTSDEFRPVQPHIAEVPEQDRFSRTEKECLEALRFDPFHANVSYVLGITKERVAREEAEYFYDRFLLMRGVDWSRKRVWRASLDGFERYAFDYLTGVDPSRRTPYIWHGARGRSYCVQSEDDGGTALDLDRRFADVPGRRHGACTGRPAGPRSGDTCTRRAPAVPIP